MDAVDEYAALVSSIYDAALDFERWPVALGRLADALDGSQAVLGKANLVNNQVAQITVRVDPVFDQLYYEYFREHKTIWQRAGARPVGTCLIDRR